MFSKRVEMGIKTELIFAHIEVWLVHIARFIISLLGVLLILPIPISLILKYKFNVKGLWLLNDREGGDIGEQWWLDKKKLKPGFWTSVRWWFRNHSWNFYKLFIPDWNAGEVYWFDILENTTMKDDIFIWCSRDGIHGRNYTIWRLEKNGKLYFRKSFANEDKEYQYGFGGNEIRIRKKPLF